MDAMGSEKYMNRPFFPPKVRRNSFNFNRFSEHPHPFEESEDAKPAVFQQLVVVFHLFQKYAQVKLDHFPKDRGNTKKSL